MSKAATPIVTAFLATALSSGIAHAQATPPAAPSPRPSSPEPLDTAAPPSFDPDALPVAKDPMLEPVPPPATVIGSWGDVLRFVHERSTDLRIAEAQVDQANAAKRRALAASLPTLTAGATLRHDLIYGNGVNVTNLSDGAKALTATRIPDPGTTLNGSLTLRQPVVNLGAWYSVGTAKERERVADLGAKEVQRELLAAVAQAAVGVITATRVAESSRVSLASDLSTLELTRRRAELGAATAVDVLRADQEVSTVRAQLVTADENLRQARETLGIQLGFTSGVGVSPNLRVEDLERTAAGACKQVGGIDARTDVAGAERNVRAAERDRNAIDYLYFPTLDFVSNTSYLSNAQSNIDRKHIAWNIGGQLTWTLYDGGDRYGQRQFTEAATRVAREQLVQKRRLAVLQLTQADRAILVAEANLEVSTKTRNIAKESARLSRLAFINGSGTSFDLVDSARRLREAEIDLLIKEFQVFQARLSAFLARSNCSI